VAKRRFQQRYNELENLHSKISRSSWGKIILNCRICGIDFVSGGSEGVCNSCHRNYKSDSSMHKTSQGALELRESYIQDSDLLRKRVSLEFDKHLIYLPSFVGCLKVYVTPTPILLAQPVVACKITWIPTSSTHIHPRKHKMEDFNHSKFCQHMCMLQA
jgi:hypothetical protein